MCECNCTAFPKSPKCNQRGTYKCGICECEEGFFGQICQCDASLVSRNDTSRCIDPSNPKAICNGEGECICGQCECTPLQVCCCYVVKHDKLYLIAPFLYSTLLSY